ncbi:MAG: Lpp/OprI family alanine-zipper lipoprotein [Gammaproteobacteria bacterium]|nr:Lpp/OprI family alanine-zipper lipoprotein [Gammaproteobacteria bacterium]
MKTKFNKTMKYGTTAVLVGLLMGCATTKDLKEVRGIAEEALLTAEQAMQMAQEAKQDAANASGAAIDAEIKADQAIRAVQDLDEKVERMFKQTMQK